MKKVVKKLKSKYKTTLVIGDAHSDPRFSNQRFEWLGRFIVDRRPDSIVQIGDWLNLDSISFYTENKPLIRSELSFKADIDAGIEAYEWMMQPIRRLQKGQRTWHKPIYKPQLIWMMGNHEERVSRYVSSKPELRGFVPEVDLVGAGKDGWLIQPYRTYHYIDGIGFTHVPIHGGGAPIAGKYIATRATELNQGTVVFGHSHRRLLYSCSRTDGTPRGCHIDGINAGCYFDYSPDYVRDHRHVLGWWAGILILTHYAPGKVDIEFVSLERIKEQYL